jgi:hypothetical protein
MSTCKTCQYWHNGDDKSGECDRAEYNYDRRGEPKSNEVLIAIQVDDDSGLDVLMKTGPDFGCVQWKAKCESN